MPSSPVRENCLEFYLDYFSLPLVFLRVLEYYSGMFWIRGAAENLSLNPSLTNDGLAS